MNSPNHDGVARSVEPAVAGDDRSIEEKIRRFVAANLLFDDHARYSDEASFLREGIIDSMGVMELVSFVQAAFGLEVSPREVTPENFDSVSRLARFIRSKQAAAPPAAG